MGWHPAASASVAAAQHWRTEDAFVERLTRHGPQMQLTSGVSLRASVRQEADISSNCSCKLDNINVSEPYDKRYFVSLNITIVICRKFEFRISTGSASTYSGCAWWDISYEFCLQFTSFSSVKLFWKSVKFRQSYRHQLVVHFLRHSVIIMMLTLILIMLFINHFTWGDGKYRTTAPNSAVRAVSAVVLQYLPSPFTRNVHRYALIFIYTALVKHLLQ